jgi:predicted nucleotidyltransferase component of viral defense system
VSGSPSGKSRPSHSTVEGRAYLGLRALAKTDGRTSAEYLRLYALEGFLARLARSPHADSLVLKGGVLLAAYDLRRPTADVDLAATVLPNDIERIGQLIASIAQVVLSPADSDGLRFDVSNLRTETIRDEDEYSGVRVTLAAHLATARETFHVDVNVGDPIWPEPEAVTFPRLLGGTISLRGYPVVMVLAEKLVTALQRGTANTRWRDFGDVYLLATRYPLEAVELRRALVEVADFRGRELEPMNTALEGFAGLAQARWLAWRNRLQLQDRLPEQFEDVLAVVFQLADPLMSVPPKAAGRWSPARRSWSE